MDLNHKNLWHVKASEAWLYYRDLTVKQQMKYYLESFFVITIIIIIIFLIHIYPDVR